MLSIVAGQAAAADAKPLVVLSMSSYDSLVADPDCVKDLGEAPRTPTSFASMFKLFSQGKVLESLDKTRPWGAVLQIQDDKLSAYGFVPVKDAEQLAAELGQYIASTSDWGNGVYRVEAPKATSSSMPRSPKPARSWSATAPALGRRARDPANVPRA